LGNNINNSKGRDHFANPGDQSYNVLIGLEGNDFDYPSKIEETPERNHSENSFEMPQDSFADDNVLEETGEEGNDYANWDEKKEEEITPMNNINKNAYDVNISLDFEDAKPNIESQSEEEPEPKNDEVVDNSNDRTLVGKSSLDETPRPSDMFRKVNPEDELAISSRDIDDIVISKTDGTESNKVTKSSLDDKSKPSDNQAKSMKSIISADLERESQREIMSNIMEYVTNGGTVHNVDPDNKEDLLVDIEEYNKGLKKTIEQIDETNASFESDEDSQKKDSNQDPDTRPKRSQSDSIQILQNSSKNDIIFQRNKGIKEVGISGDTLDDYSTVAGTVVAESITQDNKSIAKLNDLRNKFKKKNKKNDKEKLEELKRNRDKSKGKNDDPKRKKSSKLSKKMKVRQSLYHNTKSKQCIYLSNL
jgi:hypothetical protein